MLLKFDPSLFFSKNAWKNQQNLAGIILLRIEMLSDHKVMCAVSIKEGDDYQPKSVVKKNIYTHFKGFPPRKKGSMTLAAFVAF